MGLSGIPHRSLWHISQGENKSTSIGKMIVYKDVLTGEDLFTDSNKVEPRDTYYLVVGRDVIRRDDNDYNTGANPSEEEGGEDLESSAVSGIDVVVDNHLEEVAAFPSIKAFKKESAPNFKKLLGVLQERCPDFDVELYKTHSMGYMAEVGKLMKEHDDFRLFQPPIYEGFMIPSYYDDENRPILIFFKYSVKEEKQ